MHIVASVLFALLSTAPAATAASAAAPAPALAPAPAPAPAAAPVLQLQPDASQRSLSCPVPPKASGGGALAEIGVPAPRPLSGCSEQVTCPGALHPKISCTGMSSCSAAEFSVTCDGNTTYCPCAMCGDLCYCNCIADGGTQFFCSEECPITC